MKTEEWKRLTLDERAAWVRKRIECTPNDAWQFVDQIDKLVTPKMIEAGMSKLARYHRERNNEEDIVAEIYVAMRDASLE